MQVSVVMCRANTADKACISLEAIVEGHGSDNIRHVVHEERGCKAQSISAE